MATVRRIGGFVLHKQIEPAFVSRIGGFMLVGEVNLPKAIEGKLAVEDMILGVATTEIVRGQLQIGLPEVVDRFNRNTRIRVSWPDNTNVDGETYFYYNRVGVGELKIPNGFLLQGETSSYQLLPRLKTATGLHLVESDFVNSPVNDGISMKAADASYFFIPGSEIIIVGA